MDVINVEDETESLLPFVDGDAFKAAKEFAWRSKARRKAWVNYYASNLCATLHNLSKAVSILSKREKDDPERARANHQAAGRAAAKSGGETWGQSGASALRKWREANRGEARTQGVVAAARLRKLEEDPDWLKARAARSATTKAKTGSKNACGYKGVSKAWNKWRARIYMNYRTIDLGTFATPEDAARVWNVAALKYHGADAYQNPV